MVLGTVKTNQKMKFFKVFLFNIFKNKYFAPTLVILIGTAIISLTMIRSGSQYPYGIGFWGPNGHDGIWHLSLINQLQHSIPPKNPVYGGSLLSNYHWGFDLFAAVIAKVFFISNIFVYFKLMPILFGLSIGILSYLIAKRITKDNITAIFFVFLNYFAGSLGWVVTLVREGKIGGESLFWSMQSASVLLNPPYALSLIILLLGILFWINHKKTDKIYLALINGLIFGILAGTKVYAGILIGLALASFWLISFFRTKKFFNYHFWICLSTALFSILILFSLGAFKSSTLLEFKPLWFTHSMVESIDKLYLPRLASLRLNLSQNTQIIKLPVLISIELFLIGIFLIGNMGFRTFGFLTVFKKIKDKKNKEFDLLILALMFFAFIIPLLFVQKGTAWNTIQFFYYFLFFSNLFFAQFLGSLIKDKNIKAYFLVALLIIFTIPTSYSTIKDYLGNPPPAAIPTKEIEAINYLKTQGKGIILSYPFDKFKKDEYKISTPIPVYLYETTSYVSAFSEHQSFLEDEMNLDITGFDWQTRRKEIEKFFNTTDKYFARGFLLNNNIDFIYLVNDQEFKLSENDLQVDKVFDNSQVRIYKVRK
jgi:hypothetical protein